MDQGRVTKISYISGFSNRILSHLNLQLFNIGHAVLGPGYYHSRTIPGNRLQVIIRGKGIASVGKNEYDLIPGNVYLFPAMCHVELYNAGELEKIYAQFNLRHHSLDIFINEPGLFQTTINKKNIERYQAVVKSENFLSNIGMLYEILGLFSEKLKSVVEKKGALYHKYRHFFDICEDRLGENIPITEIAQFMGLNEAYFNRSFKEKFGYTPKQYILHEKLSKAKELLIFSELSINAISERMGYTDQFHFCKTFKKNIHQSPTEYRNTMRRKIP